jgi:peptidoglycan/LPS O-acetylase OafA/YrhL
MADSNGNGIPLRAAPEGEPRRLPQLDILRGIAIVLVLFHHSLVLPGDRGFLRIPYNTIAAFGWSGVDLFFVLSGFLIGGILFREIQREQSLQVGRFLIRRAFKIWPGYLVLVAYAYIGHMRHGHPLEVIRTYWANLLHLQNYFLNIRFHTWSLAVEEHFYLLLPVLLGALAASSISTLRRFFLPIALLIMGIIALFRSIHGIFWPFTFETHMYPTHLRLDSLLAGVCIAFCATFHAEKFDRLKQHRVLLMIVGLVLLVPMTMLDIERSLFAHTAGLTLLYAGYGCIMIAVLGVTPGQG